MTTPTLDEQIAHQKLVCKVRKENADILDITILAEQEAILASLQRLAAIDAVKVPEEPDYLIRLRNALKGFKSDGAFAGDKDVVEYIDTLRAYAVQKEAALKVAQQDRDNCYASLDAARRRLHEIEVFVSGGTQKDVEWQKAHDLQMKRAEKAEAEREQFRKDAERYRWLADKTLACDYGDNEKGSIGWNIGHFKGPRWIAGLSIDAAIDQARAK